jgi:ABC-type nitrate/sulfonate/bicarbonate transport system substrate-binding protein
LAFYVSCQLGWLLLFDIFHHSWRTAIDQGENRLQRYGNTQYILELPRRQGMFRKNGLDPEIVYVTSGSLLSQALIADNFDVALTRGTTPMLGKLRGSEQYIVANYSNHFNDVFLATPEITSVKQLKGKRIAVSRFVSGSDILTNLVLKQAGFRPPKGCHCFTNRQLCGPLGGHYDSKLRS